MPPRKRPSFARRHELALEVRNVLANVGALRAPDLWERYWGGRAEGRAAFEALRPKLGRFGAGVPMALPYDAWLASFLEPDDPRFAGHLNEETG